MIVRSGDDVIAGCQPTDAASRACATCGAMSHVHPRTAPDQTRLVECGRDAGGTTTAACQGTPETVDVLA